MTVYLLSDDDVAFPNPALADGEGLLAVGGDLRMERLVNAYANGIFPWYDDDSPILWWSPDPRFVLYPKELHIPRSLRRVINSRKFTIKIDTAFEEVMRNCATSQRPDEEGTWIVEEMIQAYCELNEAGLAHSIETWRDDELVGGLYGVSLGKVFYGESMFFKESDASKVAFVWLARLLVAAGFEMIDCQQVTDNLERFGAVSISREYFLNTLHKVLDAPTIQGQWTFPEEFFPL